MAESDSSANIGGQAIEGSTALLKNMQHWTWVAGRAQQMLLEHGAKAMLEGRGDDLTLAMMRIVQTHAEENLAAWTGTADGDDDADAPGMLEKQFDNWGKALDVWQELVMGSLDALSRTENVAPSAKDPRFKHDAWETHPAFRLLRQVYLAMSEQLLDLSDRVDGFDVDEKRKLRFACQSIVDAMSPSNFLLTNPAVLERAIETRGDSLLQGLERMLGDLERGQLTQTEEGVFKVGENIADTPGKVVHRTPLYELIQYAPTTDKVLDIPMVIFPPWINRFYILDLGKKKSFVRWVREQGITLFMVSWKSADASMKDIDWDDYIAAQIEAIETACRLCGTERAHTIGYCVAGTTLAATLAVLAAKGEADKVASATLFTAQVDFAEAGDMLAFCEDDHLKLVDELSEPGYLDGRYMAATFNMLRGRDLIWNYVTNNYLLGEPYRPFDLLHWNGDTTNIPAAFHKRYLRDLYRDNKLVEAGALSALGEKMDLGAIKTPLFVQSGREDHIAPPQSVIKLRRLVAGPVRFILAGSGHIAGVVNPPEAQKYNYWTNDDPAAHTVEAFLDGAEEHAGSWWPHWTDWLRTIDSTMVDAKGGRIPGQGKGKSKAAVDYPAPGDYVKMR